MIHTLNDMSVGSQTTESNLQYDVDSDNLVAA